MTQQEFTVQTEGKIQGAWLATKHGLLSLVKESDADRVSYVGIHCGDPNIKSKSIPYAMSFSADGELMLQLPNQENPADPIIVRMSTVKDLLVAAKKVT